MTGLFNRLFGKKNLQRQALIKELKYTYKNYTDRKWWIKVSYTFKRDKRYWDAAARFWTIYGKEFFDHESPEEMERIIVRVREVEWCRYNYGSSMLYPIGEYYRLDQVLAILNHNPQLRLPTGDEWMEFNNVDSFTIEQEQRSTGSTAVRCNKTNVALLFPSVHPERNPVYWAAPSDPCQEGCINSIFPYGTYTFLAKKKIIPQACSEDDLESLYSDLESVRASLRLVKRV